jgi:hypothetical protein
MDKEITQHVRQILMNELGLTREDIRNEMKLIIKDTIDKAIKDPYMEERINNYIRAAVNSININTKLSNLLKETSASVKEELGKKLGEYLSDKIEITISKVKI